jgi:thioredoxin 1
MKNLLIVFTFAGILFFHENSFTQNKKTEIKSVEQRPIVTFVELGSVNCIPCKAMQPIMKSVEKKYGEQLKVIFYDVWKDDQKQYAEKYGIRLIPTQIFINDKGKEIYRHEGFFPEAELDKFLQSKGLKVKLPDVKND